MQSTANYMGTQPVRVLKNDILPWFEGKYPEFQKELEDIAEQFSMSMAIEYYCDEAPILNDQKDDMTPIISFDGQIKIHETFLSYVWGLSYASLVIYDEYIHGPRTGEQPAHGKPLGYFLPKGYDVLNHAISLIKEFKNWPSDLPNPEIYNDEDSFYVEKTKRIYLAAVDLILCHELAHVACGHLKTLKDRGVYITPSKIKEFEHEADKWAFIHVIKGIGSPDRNKTTVGFGAVVGLGGLLFLDRNLTSQTHPDKNNRIGNLLSSLSLGELDNLWGIAATFYIIWDHAFNVGLDIYKEEFDSYKDLVQAVDDKLKPIKLKEEERRMRLD